MTSEAEPPVHTSPRQALLGLFILFQLGFLIISNLLPAVRSIPERIPAKQQNLAKHLVPGLADRSSHMGKWASHIEDPVDYWGQLIGQEQAWKLFAPGIGTSSGFPCVVLVWDTPTPRRIRMGRAGLWDVLLLRKRPTEVEFDTEVAPLIKGTRFAFNQTTGFHLCADWNPGARDLPLPIAAQLNVLGSSTPWDAVALSGANEFGKIATPERVEMLLSENEPADVRSFCRYGRTRIRRYEGQFWLDLRPGEEESPDDLAERNRNSVHKLVQQYGPYLQKYMKWRLDSWREAHPDEPGPRYVMLFQRLYHIPKPTEDDRALVGPILYPIARWMPDRQRGLDYFDGTTLMFENLSKLPQDE